MSRGRTALTVAAAAALALLAAAFMTPRVVVGVQASGRTAFEVPVPLTLLRAAVELVPESVYRDARVPEGIAAHRPAILRAVAELGSIPDTTLIAVHNEDADITVTTRNGLLLLNVDSHEDRTKVRCRIPLDGLSEALERWNWRTFDPGVFLAVLENAPRGSLVRVTAPEAHVSIGIR